MKNNACADWGPLMLGDLDPGPLNKTALKVRLDAGCRGGLLEVLVKGKEETQKYDFRRGTRVLQVRLMLFITIVVTAL